MSASSPSTTCLLAEAGAKIVVGKPSQTSSSTEPSQTLFCSPCQHSATCAKTMKFHLGTVLHAKKAARALQEKEVAATLLREKMGQRNQWEQREQREPDSPRRRKKAGHEVALPYLREKEKMISSKKRKLWDPRQDPLESRASTWLGGGFLQSVHTLKDHQSGQTDIDIKIEPSSIKIEQK